MDLESHRPGCDLHLELISCVAQSKFLTDDNKNSYFIGML